MGRRRDRPSSPAEIQARRALERGRKLQADRRVRRTPVEWGLPDDIHLLPANEDLVVTPDPYRRGKLARARRSDAFNAVSMSDEQHRAADRYVRDWMERGGVDTSSDDQGRLVVADYFPGLAPGQRFTQRMLDAGSRIIEAHREVGRASAKLLQALVEPILRGEIRVWRVVVQEVTDETERHAQAARVRQACEDLQLAYQAIDEAERARREEAKARSASPYAGGGRAG